MHLLFISSSGCLFIRNRVFWSNCSVCTVLSFFCSYGYSTPPYTLRILGVIYLPTHAVNKVTDTFDCWHLKKNTFLLIWIHSVAIIMLWKSGLLTALIQTIRTNHITLSNLLTVKPLNILLHCPASSLQNACSGVKSVIFIKLTFCKLNTSHFPGNVLPPLCVYTSPSAFTSVFVCGCALVLLLTCRLNCAENAPSST